MALVHELEAQGNVLFRNRSWIPALFVLAGVVYIYLEGMQFPVESQWLWIGIWRDLKESFIFLQVVNAEKKRTDLKKIWKRYVQDF